MHQAWSGRLMEIEAGAASAKFHEDAASFVLGVRGCEHDARVLPNAGANLRAISQYGETADRSR
jgi:hypothetical protein